VAKFHKSKKKKRKKEKRRGRKPTHPTPPLSVMKGQKLNSRDPGACAQGGPPKGSTLSKEGSCLAGDWDESVRAQQGRESPQQKSRARLLEEEDGRGQESATSDRLDCPDLFVTCPLSTPFQSGSNSGGDTLLHCILTEFLHLPTK